MDDIFVTFVRCNYQWQDAIVIKNGRVLPYIFEIFCVYQKLVVLQIFLVCTQVVKIKRLGHFDQKLDFQSFLEHHQFWQRGS